MRNIITKTLALIKSLQFELFILACFALVGIISYQFGRIRALEKTPITLSEKAIIFDAVAGPSQQKEGIAATPRPSDSRVVASKKSTSKLYHFTWCSGAKRIKEENKLWFSSSTEAERAGYTLAGNCQ